MSHEATLRQVQALSTADQGKENKDVPVALMLHFNHTLLIMMLDLPN